MTVPCGASFRNCLSATAGVGQEGQFSLPNSSKTTVLGEAQAQAVRLKMRLARMIFFIVLRSFPMGEIYLRTKALRVKLRPCASSRKKYTPPGTGRLTLSLASQETVCQPAFSCPETRVLTSWPMRL